MTELSEPCTKRGREKILNEKLYDNITLPTLNMMTELTKTVIDSELNSKVQFSG